MDSLIETFHIDAKLLFAQAINFAIVVSVLYFFAVKPLTKVMEERSKKIEKSLNEAKEIEEKLQKTDADYDAKIAEAKKDAALIMEKANEQAEVKRVEMLKKAKEEIGAVINEEKAKMQQEKAQVLKEIKGEVAELVTASLEKVLGEKIDSKKDREIIEKIVK
jgi:F-type H+-transporting ATPase subunit b